MEDWRIYNNTMQWQHLSDEHKGLLLLALHNSKLNTISILAENTNAVFCGIIKPQWNDSVVYRAKKPEPEMWELLQDDLVYAGFPQVTLSEALLKSLIAKGWTKK